MPLALTEPVLAAVIAGRCTRLRRPLGATMRRLAVGDRLWVREPFHLSAKFDGLSPTAALGFSAMVMFAADLDAAPDRFPDRTGLGKRRMARELPRAAHRQHLVLVQIHTERLQAITQAEIEAAGFPTRAAFAAAWDRNLAFFRAGPSVPRVRGQHARPRELPPEAWPNDPDVLVLTFVRVAQPLPEGDPAP